MKEVKKGREESRKEKIDRCYFCKGELKEDRISLDFRWGLELKAVVEGVPALVCKNCGEFFLLPKISEELEKIVLNPSSKPKKYLSIPVFKFR